MKAAMAPGRRTGTRAASAVGRSRLTEADLILDLQRDAGNRAVAALLAGHTSVGVQRALSVSPRDLRAGRTGKERLRSVFVKDTYGKILSALRDFEAKPDVATGVLIVRLIDYWKSKYGSDSRPRYVARLSQLEDVRAEVWRDVGKLRAEAEYTKDFEGGEGRWSPLKGASQLTKLAGLGTAKQLAQGTTNEKMSGQGGAALELVKKYKLSEAEIAAIRTYTMGDYQYINPATASNQPWLKANIAGGAGQFNTQAGERTLLEEGRLHAGVMMEGVKKLPKWKGLLYRGERVSPAEFKDRYAGRSKIEQLTFGSASKSFSVAQKFANGEGDKAPPDA